MLDLDLFLMMNNNLHFKVDRAHTGLKKVGATIFRSDKEGHSLMRRGAAKILLVAEYKQNKFMFGQVEIISRWLKFQAGCPADKLAKNLPCRLCLMPSTPLAPSAYIVF